MCVGGGGEAGVAGRRHLSPLSSNGVWGARADAKRFAFVISCGPHVLLSLGHTGLTRPSPCFSLMSPILSLVLSWCPLTLHTFILFYFINFIYLFERY